jgi:hypothetical protein
MGVSGITIGDALDLDRPLAGHWQHCPLKVPPWEPVPYAATTSEDGKENSPAPRGCIEPRNKHSNGRPVRRLVVLGLAAVASLAQTTKRMGQLRASLPKVVRLPLPVAALAKRLAEKSLRAGDINDFFEIEATRPLLRCS